MLKKLFNILALLLCSVAMQAQEFNCKVVVTRGAAKGASNTITGLDPQIFTDMQKAVANFVNSRRWTTDEFGTNEKIDCNIFITITSNNIGGDPNAFSGSFSIQASRPVYNSAYTSIIVNTTDNDFTFKYSQFNPLNFDDNNAGGMDGLTSNLTAIIAYYMYVVLAMDYDSFSPMGGSAYLKRAQNIVNSPPTGKGISGWDNKDQNKNNRFWLIDQLQNQRFLEARNFWYIMHREGLDSMSAKPIEARTRILTNIKKLYQINRENPSSALIQFILTTKSTEFLKMVEAAPRAERPQYISMLAIMDVTNAGKYNALK